MNQTDPPYEYLWPKSQLKGDEAIPYLAGHKTFTEVLADNGYQCGLSGKWHIGDSATPQAGFTYWHTEAMGGDNYYYPVVLEDGEMTMKKNVYVTDYITDNALDFLRGRDKERPFCLAVHYTAPHNGVRFIHAQYAPIREEWQQYRRESLRGYFAAVTAMDAAVGRLLDELEAQGLRENTLVVFTSDNGSNMGHHGIFGKGNGTYPQNMYDSSVKIPGLFSFPGKIPAGKVCEELYSHYDLYDTILDMAGVPYERDETRPGVSFADALLGGTNSGRDGVVVYDEYGPVRMIRTRDVHRFPDGPNELYDLVNDPGEDRNLVDDPRYATLIRDMKARLTDWFQRYVDPALDGSKDDVRGKGQLDSHHFVH